MPNIFDDIQIRTLCWPGEEIDSLLLTKIFGDVCSMWGCFILLEHTWPIFITIECRNASGELFPPQRDIICGIHFQVTDHQPSDAIRHNEPRKHDGECSLKVCLEFWLVSPNPQCSGIICEYKVTFIRENGVILELSRPFTESFHLLKTVSTIFAEPYGLLVL